MKIRRTSIRIRADIKRVLLRPFTPGSEERIVKIINRVLALSEEAARQQLQSLLTDFESRHLHLRQFYQRRFEENSRYLNPKPALSEARKLLIGAYFSMEYSLEAAALFNPSMIWHPDQSGLPGGHRRFIISLRATGEGHISSLTFRSGTIDARCRIIIDEPSRYVTTPEIRNLNDSDYQLAFSADQRISERVIFPAIPLEGNGIEDARFVEFRDEDARRTYYATYTAYDGRGIHSRLLKTSDFLNFEVNSLRGAAVENKGLALFPRKINRRYAMLSRQDNENNYLMFSDDLYRWDSKTLIQEPQYSWEFVQLGNCGSPLETEAGWLVLSHAVGPMRNYVLSAFLLDLNNPEKVIGRLKQPLIMPNESEREGYVPNVVYSCGAQIWVDQLIIPYAVSDYASSFALINMNDLLDELTGR